jgi:hypothetical protein
MGIDIGPIEVTDGLVYWYDTSNTRSFSGSGNTLNSISTASSMSIINGYSTKGSGAGLAISLSAVNSYTLTDTNLYSQFPNSSTSMFIWAYSVGAGNIVSELGQAVKDSGWHDSNIEINGSGNVSMSVWHGGLTNKVVSSSLSFNKWYYIGWTYDGTTLIGYVNGNSVGTTTLTRQRNGSAIYYTIGASDSSNMGTNAYWKGMFSYFSVYNRALSATEILQNYNATKGRYR